MKNKIKSFLTKYKLIGLATYLSYFISRYFINQQFRNFVTRSDTTLKKVDSSEQSSSFFGYYNISPENSEGHTLFCKTNYANNRPDGDLELYIQHQDTAIQFGITKAWNWQQGCMLQWYSKSKDMIIYNDYSTDKLKYISIIKDLRSNKEKEIDMPIYTVSKDGAFALSLNFERLAILRPDYGYFNTTKKIESLPKDEDDGIFYIDILNNRSNLLISLADLKKVEPCDSMKGALHKVNHIDISPDGSRFIFLHRWVGPEGRFMRLLESKIDGKSLQILNGDKMTSHSCWFGNDKVISFCNTDKFGDRYIEFNIHDRSRKVILNLPCVDGHPSISPDGKWLITDSYPSRDRMSELFLYNIEKGQLISIGKFFQPFRFQSENRIDLHPKWNSIGSSIYFESGHTGTRKLYSINLENIFLHKS